MPTCATSKGCRALSVEDARRGYPAESADAANSPAFSAARTFINAAPSASMMKNMKKVWMKPKASKMSIATPNAAAMPASAVSNQPSSPPASFPARANRPTDRMNSHSQAAAPTRPVSRSVSSHWSSRILVFAEGPVGTRVENPSPSTGLSAHSWSAGEASRVGRCPSKAGLRSGSQSVRPWERRGSASPRAPPAGRSAPPTVREREREETHDRARLADEEDEADHDRLIIPVREPVASRPRTSMAATTSQRRRPSRRAR